MSNENFEEFAHDIDRAISQKQHQKLQNYRDRIESYIKSDIYSIEDKGKLHYYLGN